MDKFLGAFSLQNFLRQFFCGVVFFVPFFLAPSSSVNKSLWSSVGSLFANLVLNANRSTSNMVMLGIFACIIGTIIYHLEKNLYSYGVQAIFERLILERAVTIFGIILISTVTIIFFMMLSGPIGCFVAFVVELQIVRLFYGDRVIRRTRLQWIAEHSRRNTKKNNSNIIVSYNQCNLAIIARKIAYWSDFIHCSQSCCFAFVIGCFTATRLGIAIPGEKEMLYIVAIVLILEAFFDWHRYQHVIYITERVQDFE